MDGFTTNLAAGAVSNFIFVCLFAVGAYLKQRLNNSDCHMNCGWLTCDSSLQELQVIKKELSRTQGTQHKILKDIIKMLRENDEQASIRLQPGARL